MTLFRSAALSLVFAFAAVAVTPTISEARGTPDGFVDLAKIQAKQSHLKKARRWNGSMTSLAAGMTAMDE